MKLPPAVWRGAFKLDGKLFPIAGIVIWGIWYWKGCMPGIGIMEGIVDVVLGVTDAKDLVAPLSTVMSAIWLLSAC